MNAGPQSPQKSPFPAASDSLSEKQRTAIALLLTGKTNTATAEEIGVDRKTVWAWKQEPAFAAALNAELEALREAAQVRMLALAGKAFDALERMLANADTDSARIAAVKLVLERLFPSNAPAEGKSPADNGA